MAPAQLGVPVHARQQKCAHYQTAKHWHIVIAKVMGDQMLYLL